MLYNEFNQIISETYYDTDEQPVVSTEHHCAKRSFQYNERGYNTYIWYWGPDDQTMERDDYGAALYYREYDDYNRRIWEVYYDRETNPVIRKDLGYAARRDTYEGNNLVKITYCDTEFQPMIYQELGYASLVYQYNDQGQIQSIAYYDSEDKLINNKDGTAMIQYEYDEFGNVAEIFSFDQSGDLKE